MLHLVLANFIRIEGLGENRLPDFESGETIVRCALHRDLFSVCCGQREESDQVGRRNFLRESVKAFTFRAGQEPSWHLSTSGVSYSVPIDLSMSVISSF